MAKYQITTDELDFDLVKRNIKEFMKSQSLFTDYDFEGSALSILIDLLAYNTLYNSFYNHLTINEMFLDSASKYSSSISLAKTIGYTAGSSKSASAILSVIISGVPENPTVLTLPAGTTFRATIGDKDFEFVTITDYSASNNLGQFAFNSIEVKEGAKLSKKYIAGTSNNFVVPNSNADMSTLSVTIQENLTSSSFTKFTRVDDLLNVKATDTVFFVKQKENTLYEVFFGNDVLGKSVVPGNVVILDYVVSSGSAANGARSFVYTSGFRSDVFYTITTEQIALGGNEPESTESVKFNAPRMYVTQNRAVAADDYSVLLTDKFTNIESINVWGGQHNVPPVYGKVFVVAKPVGRETFLQDEKDQMYSFITEGKNVATITPVFLDPEYLRLQIVTNVYYNKNLSRKTPGELASLVRQTILNYSTNLNKFGDSFRFSQLSTSIDNTDAAIISNITTVKIRKSVEPVYNVKTKYTIRIENPIYQDKDTGETIWSTRFYIGSETDRCYFKDDGNGNIDLYLEDTLGNARYSKTIGTVNYSSGVIEITDVLIRGLYDAELEVMCTPLSNDVIPIRQYLVSIPSELVTINVLSDVETSSGIKQNHIFSPSR